LASILDGKGDEMPSWRAKLSEKQARGLVAYIRAFTRNAERPEQVEPKEPTPGTFEERRRRLEKQMDELKKEFREASEGSAEDRPKPSENLPRPPPSKPAVPSPRSASSNSYTPAVAATPTDREVFRRHCAKCHGEDGTGTTMRGRQPELPNFADPAWQARQRDAQLLASILDGKGKRMPSWWAKLSEEQARGLVAYVRTFASRPDRPGQGGQDEPLPDELVEAELPGGFFEKLLGWLGQFHPPTVHFPIALLTAAAVAELLRLALGNPRFDDISRYCLWFGTLTAVPAGVLGWFLAGFRLNDPSWTMTLHRWLGTSTVAGAALVLVWGEVSRRAERHGSRAWFRVALLVEAVLALVTGFFGGAVVFGLDHYAWPP
jgi:mono/diheme cytochrome c family protein/uncharacterized membrane protein